MIMSRLRNAIRLRKNNFTFINAGKTMKALEISLRLGLTDALK